MTYSIVARDPSTGELGVAVQSHWFSVGTIVPWAAPGVGAVATQANARADYGPRGLELMASGLAACDALASLVAADPGRDSRQVAMVDAGGNASCWTGAGCTAFAGDIQGDGVSCQANIMASEAVWPAMLEAFLWESGPLASRLLAALVAGEAAGGDLRGRQSAALLVVPSAGSAWEAVVSLRVEDCADPLGELTRLRGLHEAYALAGEADDALARGEMDVAADGYRRAAELAPESDELRFWSGLGAAHAGDREAAVAQVRSAVAAHAGWSELLGRLPADVAPPWLMQRLG